MATTITEQTPGARGGVTFCRAAGGARQLSPPGHFSGWVAGEPARPCGVVALCLLAAGIPFMCLRGSLLLLWLRDGTRRKQDGRRRGGVTSFLALGVLPALFGCGKSWLLRGGQEQPEKCLFAGARVPVLSPARGRRDLSLAAGRSGGEGVRVWGVGWGKPLGMPAGSCSPERQIW